MATPNSFSVSNSNGRFTLTLTLSETTNTSANTSAVGYTLTLKANTNYRFEGYRIGRTVKLNGTTVYSVTKANSAAFSVAAKGSITVASGTATISHDSNGKKSISVSFSIDMASDEWTPGSLSGSGTAVLTDIPRYAAITAKSAEVLSETSVRLNWTTDSVCDYAWYSTDNGASWTAYDMPDSTGGSKVIAGLAPNTAYNLKVRVRRKDSQLNTDSGTVSVKTYDKPKCTICSDFFIGNNTAVFLYNPLNRTITVSIVNTAHNTVYASATTTGTSVVVTPTASALYAAIPAAKEGTYHVKVYCAAINSVTYTATGAKFSVKESECLPTFGELTYSDTNTKTSPLSGSSIIQNQSTMRASVTAATPKNSATITKYKFWIGTVVKTTNTAGSVDFGTINASSDVKLYCEATDSRGFTCKKNVTVTIIPYSEPSAVVKLARQNNYEDTSTITIDAKATNITGNEAVVTYGVKDTEQATETFTGSKTVTATYTLPKENVYEFTVQVTDTIGGTPFTGTFTLPKGKFPFFIDTALNAIGINDFPQSGEALRVNGKVVCTELPIPPTYIAGNTDLDDIITPGEYVCPFNGAGWVDSLQNCPVNSAFALKVIQTVGRADTGIGLRQIIQTYTDNFGIYVRNKYYSGGFGAWIQIYPEITRFNQIRTTSDDTPARWVELGNGTFYFSLTGCLISQPKQWGFVINHVAAADVFQIWHSQPSGDICIRSGNGNGWANNGNWTKIGGN